MCRGPGAEFSGGETGSLKATRSQRRKVNIMDGSSYHNGNFNGKGFARAMRGSTRSQRAALAAQLTNGTAIGAVTNLQAAALADVSSYSVSIARNATPAETEALLGRRICIRDVRKAHAKPRELSDADIVAFINRANPNRVLAILDHLTAPNLPVAAE